MPHSIGPFFPHVKYSITVYKIYKITRHFLKKKQLDISVKKLDPLKIINGKDTKDISSHCFISSRF